MSVNFSNIWKRNNLYNWSLNLPEGLLFHLMCEKPQKNSKHKIIDGVLTHFSRIVRQHLDKIFTSWIGRWGTIPWHLYRLILNLIKFQFYLKKKKSFYIFLRQRSAIFIKTSKCNNLLNSVLPFSLMCISSYLRKEDKKQVHNFGLGLPLGFFSVNWFYVTFLMIEFYVR